LRTQQPPGGLARVLRCLTANRSASLAHHARAQRRSSCSSARSATRTPPPAATSTPPRRSAFAPRCSTRCRRTSAETRRSAWCACTHARKRASVTTDTPPARPSFPHVRVRAGLLLSERTRRRARAGRVPAEVGGRARDCCAQRAAEPLAARSGGCCGRRSSHAVRTEPRSVRPRAQRGRHTARGRRRQQVRGRACMPSASHARTRAHA
jgi:hypothetical protein